MHQDPLLVNPCFYSEMRHGIVADPVVTPTPTHPGYNGRRVADDIFKRIFVNEKVLIFIKILLKCFPKGPIDNNQALV